MNILSYCSGGPKSLWAKIKGSTGMGGAIIHYLTIFLLLALRLTPFCRRYKLYFRNMLAYRTEFSLQERHPKALRLGCRASGLPLMGSVPCCPQRIHRLSSSYIGAGSRDSEVGPRGHLLN